MSSLPFNHCNVENNILPAPKHGVDRINLRISDDLYIQFLKNIGMEAHLILIVYKSVLYLTNLKGVREMLEVLPLHELLEVYRKLEEDIFLFQLHANDRMIENQLKLLGLDVERTIQAKLPTSKENQEIIKLTDSTREPLTSRKTVGILYGWYYPYELEVMRNRPLDY